MATIQRDQTRLYKHQQLDVLRKKWLYLAFMKQAKKLKSNLCQQTTYEETSMFRDMANHTYGFITLNDPAHQFLQRKETRFTGTMSKSKICYYK